MNKIIDWLLITTFIVCLICVIYFGYKSKPSDHMQVKDEGIEVVHIVSETSISCESKKIVVIKEK